MIRNHDSQPTTTFRGSIDGLMARGTPRRGVRGMSPIQERVTFVPKLDSLGETLDPAVYFANHYDESHDFTIGYAARPIPGEAVDRDTQLLKGSGYLVVFVTGRPKTVTEVVYRESYNGQVLRAENEFAGRVLRGLVLTSMEPEELNAQGVDENPLIPYGELVDNRRWDYWENPQWDPDEVGHKVTDEQLAGLGLILNAASVIRPAAT
jgi:hypothetical protein